MDGKGWLKKYWRRVLLVFGVILGVYLLLVGYTQTPITATTKSVSVTYRHTHRRRSRTSYHNDLTVDYEENGEKLEATVSYYYKSLWDKPHTGDQIQIVRGAFGGMVCWPDQNARVYGWMLMVMCLFFLALARYSDRTAENRDREPDRISDNPFSGQITLGEDGMYHWSCQTDREYEQGAFKTTMWACGGICAFLILAGIVTGDGEVITIMLLCTGIAMLIAFGISAAMYRGSGHVTLSYEMNDRYIHIGQGKGSRYISFRNVKGVSIQENKLLVDTGGHKDLPVFVPEEDLEKMREYIQKKINRRTMDP